MENLRICFIGCGNMGKSLIGGIINNGYSKDLVCGADPDPQQRQNVKSLFGIEVFDNNLEAIRGADIIVLAVKPQIMKSTVLSLAAGIESGKVLFISIAAGIRLSAINKWLKREDAAVVRVMPNTPALIQAGAAVLFANPMVNNEQKEIAETIMRSVGVALWVEHESLLDTVTALSGSGPAYFFLVMEALQEAAIDMGLQPDQARLLTLETALGAAKMAMESSQDVAALRRQVTSPGGTTEQAVKVLQEGNLEKLFHDALLAAHRRSVELADEFGDKE